MTRFSKATGYLIYTIDIREKIQGHVQALINQDEASKFVWMIDIICRA